MPQGLAGTTLGQVVDTSGVECAHPTQVARANVRPAPVSL
jgi:hypothetical protein